MVKYTAKLSLLGILLLLTSSLSGFFVQPVMAEDDGCYDSDASEFICDGVTLTYADDVAGNQGRRIIGTNERGQEVAYSLVSTDPGPDGFRYDGGDDRIFVQACTPLSGGVQLNSGSVVGSVSIGGAPVEEAAEVCVNEFERYIDVTLTAGIDSTSDSVTEVGPINLVLYSGNSSGSVVDRQDNIFFDIQPGDSNASAVIRLENDGGLAVGLYTVCAEFEGDAACSETTLEADDVAGFTAVAVNDSTGSVDTDDEGTVIDEGSVIGIEQVDFRGDAQRCKTGAFNLPFRWILCPLITLLFNTINTLYTGFIIPVLYYSPLSESDEGPVEGNLFDIWNSFRIVANALFMVVFLLAIFGQSLAGFQIFSAYDIRKIIPRLVIGIIMVQLSWFFVGFMVDVFNVLGGGIRGLMLAPVDGLQFSVNFDLEGNWIELASTVGIIGGVSAGLWVGGIVMGLPLILYPIIAGMIAAFITIMIRRALITMLIVTAPIAFVAWILPNTAGMFRSWWGWFWKALLVYPLVIALLASGELFAKIITASNTAGDGTQQSVINSIIAVIALFAPYFFIPFVFRLAGGALTAVSGGLDRQSQNMNRRLFGDQRDPGSYRGRRRRKQVEGRVNRKQRLMNASNQARRSSYGRGPGASRTSRNLGRILRAGGAATYAAGTVTGRGYADRAAELDEEANKVIKSWLYQGEEDRIFAILGDKNIVSGHYQQDEDGNNVFVGKDLKPSAILAAQGDRKSPSMVQGALNQAMYLAAGQVDPVTGVSKIQDVYEHFYNGGGIMSRYDKQQRKEMLSRAADYNAGHMPDYLFRDPENGFAMPGFVQEGDSTRALTPADGESYRSGIADQSRYLSRINERLGSDRDLDALGPSAWQGASDIMGNAQAIYERNTAGGAAFDPTKLDNGERDLLKRAYRMHQGLNLSPSGGRAQGPARSNEQREALKTQMFGFMGGRNGAVAQDLRNL